MLGSYPIGGKFGKYGGKYIPETLAPAIEELESAYDKYKNDPEFQKELSYYLTEYAGRPTPLYFAKNLTKHIGGAKIYLKREDLLHGGAHKTNNTLGQALLAKKMGKKRIIAETGAGQHGVGTAIACAVLGLSAEIYMGAKDFERQKLNAFRMELLGAKVYPVQSGSKTLKDAINEAIRDWIANVKTTYYLIGSVVGPHPYPMMVRDFQSVIGSEIKQQIREIEGTMPNAIVACVGGGRANTQLRLPLARKASCTACSLVYCKITVDRSLKPTAYLLALTIPASDPSMQCSKRSSAPRTLHRQTMRLYKHSLHCQGLKG